MSYEWYQRKASVNFRRHGVRFAHAVQVFADDRAVIMPDTSSSEERFIILGADMLGRILVVVYTYRGDRIRLISARKADSDERRQYGGLG
jgi:hypothetical protein